MSAPASPTIAVVGAGGLGGPLVWALTAAGARVVVCDPDVVELSNLQRQVQFATADVGRAKAAALADEAARRGVADRVRAIAARFDATTADAIAGAADVVVDGSDSPAT
ncbi:MAG: ThiF family adenylyltransferase, partial [Myxococcales bacterium]|nr:ThiF family adenylyltransferase [Myxococcales bacterium]